MAIVRIGLDSVMPLLPALVALIATGNEPLGGLCLEPGEVALLAGLLTAVVAWLKIKDGQAQDALRGQTELVQTENLWLKQQLDRCHEHGGTAQ